MRDYTMASAEAPRIQSRLQSPAAAEPIGEGRSLALADTPRIVERSVGSLAGLAGIEPPLLRRIYAGRGVSSSSELDYRLDGLPHFSDLRGIHAACGMVADAIGRGSRIRVVGDFDADGATSTALVCEALQAMGAADIDYCIPHRVRHGYGLSPGVVEAIGDAGPAGLVITVDNGIASHDGVDAARAAGWQVLVCDHHLPGNTLPAADAIVNPNQPGCSFAAKSLAGVGVAFYLMAGLRACLTERGVSYSLPRLSDYLDLVALGTVADVVPLDHVNRSLVSQGLRRIREGRARPGIAALAEVAGRAVERLDTADIGFALAPRLNAAGRLDDMGIGVACLRCREPARARALAATLATINRRRQALQQRMQADADVALQSLEEPPHRQAGITVYRDDWHEGVVGLIAGRLCERYQRPVVAFAQAEHGLLKGSARSIAGVHVRDVLAAIDAESPGLIARFGGHARAAGLALSPGLLSPFSAAFERCVQHRLTAAMTQRELITDGQLDADDLCLERAWQLRNAGPWGAGFEAPLFHGRFDILAQRIVGAKHLKLEVQPVDGEQAIEAMCFNRATRLEPTRPYRLVYRLQVNIFQARARANLIIEHLREISSGSGAAGESRTSHSVRGA